VSELGAGDCQLLFPEASGEQGRASSRAPSCGGIRPLQPIQQEPVESDVPKIWAETACRLHSVGRPTKADEFCRAFATLLLGADYEEAMTVGHAVLPFCSHHGTAVAALTPFV